MANETEWTPEQGAITVKDESESSGAPEGLRKSPFRDEQVEGVYHLEIKVTGGTVYAREMDDETYEEFSRRQKAFQELIDKPLQIEREALRLEESGQLARAMDLRFSAQNDSQSARKDNRDFTLWLLKKVLAGWSFKGRAFSIKAFSQLRGDDQNAVISEIVRASTINREDADFLADVSLVS